MATDSRIGDRSEYAAILWLSDQGYEVFQNFGCDGPIDLVAVDITTGETILVDVKTITKYLRKDGVSHYHKLGKRTELQKALKVQYLGVDRETRECFWYEGSRTSKSGAK